MEIDLMEVILQEKRLEWHKLAGDLITPGSTPGIVSTHES